MADLRRPAVAGTLLQLGSSRRRGQTARGPCKAEIVIADQDAAVVGELLAREGADMMRLAKLGPDKATERYLLALYEAGQQLGVTIAQIGDS